METTIFDEDGDIGLLLDQKDDETFGKRFVVSSKAMSLASPVWKAMFNGKFREGAKEGDVLLPDDDSWALDFMLNLVHLKFATVTTSELSTEEMVKIAVICDKYDLVELCRFHVAGWVEKCKDSVNKEPVKYPGMIFFAWVFGYSSLVLTQSGKLISDCAMPVSGTLKAHLLPSNLLERIDAAAMSLWNRLLSCAYRAYNRLLNYKDNPDTPTVLCQSKSCNTYLLGSLVALAHQNGIHFDPVLCVANCTLTGKSSAWLASVLKGFCIEPFAGSEYSNNGYASSHPFDDYNTYKHKTCRELKRLKSEVDNVMSWALIVLEDRDFKHMEAQARKLGEAKAL